MGKTPGEAPICRARRAPTGEGSQGVVDAYPLDGLERKLISGARKGVTLTVVTWCTAHLEHTLGLPAE